MMKDTKDATIDVLEAGIDELNYRLERSINEANELEEALDGPKSNLWSRLTNERIAHGNTRHKVSQLKAQCDELAEALRAMLAVTRYGNFTEMGDEYDHMMCTSTFEKDEWDKYKEAHIKARAALANSAAVATPAKDAVDEQGVE